MSQVDRILTTDIVSWCRLEHQIRGEILFGPAYFANDLSRWVELQSQNARRFSRVLDERGWPGLETVGLDGARAAAELVVHSISQPALMRRCLPLVEQAARFGRLQGEWFARLYDTIMFFENRPQVFGTFFSWDERGKQILWQVVEPGRLEERRRIFTITPGQPPSQQIPPANVEEYRLALDTWARARGWKREPLG